MAKDPAVLFYTSDFLTGTMLMTDEEVGQYIKLLCLQHQKGRLTANHMLTICKTLDSEVIAKFEKDSKGLYYNVRMEEEAIKRKNFTESRKSNGSKGGRPKAEKPSAKPSGKPYAKPSENLTENENVNEDIDKNKGEKGKFKPPKLNDVKDYFKSNGYTEEAAIKYFNYYDVAKWVDSKGNKIKNWKQKAQGVWFKEENKLSCKTKQKFTY